jgi:hypothetical protein
MAAAAVILVGSLYVVVGESLDGPGRRPGAPEVYERIEQSRDCEALREDFDTAMGSVERYPADDSRRDAPVSYAEAARARLHEVGCD